MHAWKLYFVVIWAKNIDWYLLYYELHHRNDLWALGCTLYQMLSGSSPFKDASEWLIFQRIIARDLKFPEYFSAEARDLIDKLLVCIQIPIASMDHVHKFLIYYSCKWNAVLFYINTTNKNLKCVSSGNNESTMQTKCVRIPTAYFGTNEWVCTLWTVLRNL